MLINYNLVTKIIFMNNKILENLEQLKKMLVLLSEDRKVVLSHHKTFEHVEKMRSIVNESIEMANNHD
ncbi:MAG: hypothetical protein ACJ0FL_02790 [Gammaproteobacteria bacterium]|tara:strand:+ start:218 stop:421 length:204 start_codon:yes stop_codon:yes gene_type:complete